MVVALTLFHPKDRAGPSCHFLVHVVLDNCVFLESSSRCGQSLSVSTHGVANLANFGEDDTQFVVRIVVCWAMMLILMCYLHLLI